PRFVRVTLGGDELAGFSAPGPADHVKLFFPVPGGEPVSRDYTPFAFRADDSGGPELDIDFYLHHSADSQGGPAISWATAAKPGGPIRIGGPRGSHLAPGDADDGILVADETALPAGARWLDAFGETAAAGAGPGSGNAPAAV